MENFDLIERYLLNTMSDEEKAAFEARLANEPELNQEKEAIAEMILGVESFGLKQKLKGRTIGGEQTDKIIEMKPKSSSIFTLRKFATAASIAAIFFCGWWFMKPGVNAEDQLFAQAFHTDPGLPTKMGESQNYNFYDAMVEYKMENYDKAIEIWKTTAGTIGADTLNYYLGMAYLNNDQLSEAQQQLESIAENSVFSNKAKWYQLSMLIQAKKYEEAKKMLESFPSSIHPSYNQVSEFLENK
ncbi:MAG: hypothetical protein P1U56_25945 [Saprospiraceae bacterium]|nr:hypothetical protein [Saprospiraceae bacterium]